MYTSGQLAIMGNVGRKTLRLYREEGLLIPSMTNEENGYHYYDESQLETLEKIKRYRSINLSLFEIKKILNGEEDEKEIITCKIKETDKSLNNMKEMISEINTATTQIHEEEEVDIRPFQKCTCIFVDENIDLEKLGKSVGKLYEKASKNNIKIAGSHFVRYDGLNKDMDFSMKTCLPVLEYASNDTLNIYEEKCLHINFKGGFSKVSVAHRIIQENADKSGIKLAGCAYEVYNADMSVDVYYGVAD